MRLTVAEELERLRTLRELRGDRLDPVPSILTLDDAVRKAAESRSRCSLCHCEIPPGRAGRKCQQCRTWYQCDCTGSRWPDFCMRCDRMMEPIVDDDTAKGPKERSSLKEFVDLAASVIVGDAAHCRPGVERGTGSPGV